MKQKNKRKKWLKFRHKAVTAILKPFLGAYAKIKYKIKCEKFKEQGKRQYPILMNHQTSFDQFFVAMCFKGPIYYIATEDIFSMGFVSKLIKYLVAPIPIKKQTTDVRAVLNCMHISKEGGTIALAPEGNRTYSGRTEHIKPSIVDLAKRLKQPIAIFRIEGGYGVQPRWSNKIRKGNMKAYVSRVIEPAEYENMPNDELYKLITESLYVDESGIGGEFKSKTAAEYLERVFYVCPECGLSGFESSGDKIKCQKCGIEAAYTSDKQLVGTYKPFPFDRIGKWYDYQNSFINSFDCLSNLDTALYSERASLYEVVLYKNKKLISKDIGITLYGDRVCFENGLVCSFDETDVITVLGKNKLNIYRGGKVYQLKGGKRFNALKYMNLYFRYKNQKEGNGNGKFLGI